jgi:hypothetical protein
MSAANGTTSWKMNFRDSGFLLHQPGCFGSSDAADFRVLEARFLFAEAGGFRGASGFFL